MFVQPYKHNFYLYLHIPYTLLCLLTLRNIPFMCVFMDHIRFFFPPQMLLILCLTAYYLSTQVILVAQLNSTPCYHPETIPANNRSILAKKQTNQPSTSGSRRFLGKSLVPKRPLFPFLHICTTEGRDRALPTLDRKQHALSPQML